MSTNLILHLTLLVLIGAIFACKHRRFIGNYIYFRKRRFGHADAWHLARDTL